MLGSLKIIYQYMTALYMKVISCLDDGILNKEGTLYGWLCVWVVDCEMVEGAWQEHLWIIENLSIFNKYNYIIFIQYLNIFCCSRGITPHDIVQTKQTLPILKKVKLSWYFIWDLLTLISILLFSTRCTAWNKVLPALKTISS